jgi:4-hydroxy-2-oxoheptanedioate aldolase
VEIVELLAYAGFDAVVLDLEHGPYGVEALPPLIAAGHAAGLACIVRVPDTRAQPIGAVLDAGADAVVVPHVQSGREAAEVVSAARFAPAGDRGTNPYVRAARYSADQGFVAEANEKVAVLAMVEGKEGIEAIDDILGVEGLDAVFLGPVDVSMALGVPGQPEHRLVLKALSELIERARAKSVATAVFAPTAVAAARWLKSEVRLVAVSVDTALMLNGFQSILSDIRALADTEISSALPDRAAT